VGRSRRHRILGTYLTDLGGRLSDFQNVVSGD